MSKAKAAKISKMPDSLRQKMAKAVSGTSPSMLPEGIGATCAATTPVRAKAPKEEKPTLETLVDARTSEIIANLIEQQEGLNSQKKAIERELEPIEESIKNHLNSHGIVGSFLSGDCNVSYSSRSRTYIDETLLLSCGVKPEVIESCKKTSYSNTLTIKRS